MQLLQTLRFLSLSWLVLLMLLLAPAPSTAVAPKTRKNPTAQKHTRVLLARKSNRRRYRRNVRRRAQKRSRRKKVSKPSVWKQRVSTVWLTTRRYYHRVFYKRPSFLSWLLLVVLFVVLLGLGHGLQVFVSSRQGLEKVQQLAKKGKPWDVPDFPYYVQNRFVELAGYWAQNDESSAQPLVHPDFQELYFAELRQNKQKNLYHRHTRISIQQVEILAIHHDPRREEWAFLARIEGQMNSGVYDERGFLLKSLGSHPKSTERPIGELYFFQYHLGRWKLAGVISTVLPDESRTQRFYDYFERKPWLRRLTKVSRRNLVLQKVVQLGTWLLTPLLTWLAYHLFT